MKLDEQSIEWIQKALEMAPFGKVTLVTQNKRIMKIITESQNLVTISLNSSEGVDKLIPIADYLKQYNQS